MQKILTATTAKQRAITLVELLIVIIIIGILAGAMLMLRASSSDKAEASRIISDLRTLKVAVSMYQVAEGANPPPPLLDDLKKHVDRAIPPGYEVHTRSSYSRGLLVYPI